MWQDKGYHILFTGNQNIKALVENEGFEFCEFKYGIEYNIKSFKAFLGLSLKTLFDRHFTIKRYRDFYVSFLEAKNILKKYELGEIFIDEHLSEYSLFFKNYDISVSILNTKLSTKKTKGVPPLNSNYIAKGKFMSNIFCEILWIKEFINLKGQELLQKVAFCGKDEIYFWKRLGIKNGWDYNGFINNNHCFYRTINNIETIILAPQALEFKHRKMQKRESFFHVPTKKNESKYKTDTYEKLLSEIFERKKNSTLKIVYVTFGTLSGMESNAISNFFMRLCNALTDEKDILLVFSKGEVEINLIETNNIKVFSYVPQIDFLQYVDLVITHGGLGTIKECYDANVPLYILPFHKKTDLNGNSARIAANLLGIAGSLKKDSEQLIRKKVLKLLKC